jgi:hypothetical protein
VSCPDWGRLIEHRFDARRGLDDEPHGWQEALRHSEECRICRRQALALDPTLLFSSLGHGESPEGAASLAGLGARVRSALRAREMERSLELPRERLRERRVPAAAAALLMAAGLLLATHGGRVTPPAATGDRTPRPAHPTIARWAFGDVALPAADVTTPPLIESLDRPQARVYQLGQDDDLSLVMIVDESLDV